VRGARRIEPIPVKIVAIFALAALALVPAYFLFRPFFSVVISALVLAVLTYPLYDRLRRRIPETLAAVTVAIGVAVLLALPMFLAAVALLQQIESAGVEPGREQAFVERTVVQLDRALRPFTGRFGRPEALQDLYDQNREAIDAATHRIGGRALAATGRTLILGLLALFALIFMLRDGHRLLPSARALVPLPTERTQLLLDRLQATVRAVFVGFVLLAFVQTAVAGTLYWALGAPNWVLWTFVTLILCMVPVLNAPIVFVPMGIYFLVQGQWHKTLILYVIGFGVVSVIDNIIRPIVIGRQVDLHPAAILFALLSGIFAFGPIGIMVGPMVLTLLLSIADALREMADGPAGVTAEAAG
jgi:predicted PurR-regulated permease PerM